MNVPKTKLIGIFTRYFTFLRRNPLGELRYFGQHTQNNNLDSILGFLSHWETPTPSLLSVSLLSVDFHPRKRLFRGWMPYQNFSAGLMWDSNNVPRCGDSQSELAFKHMLPSLSKALLTGMYLNIPDILPVTFKHFWLHENWISISHMYMFLSGTASELQFGSDFFVCYSISTELYFIALWFWNLIGGFSETHTLAILSHRTLHFKQCFMWSNNRDFTEVNWKMTDIFWPSVGSVQFWFHFDKSSSPLEMYFVRYN